MKKREMTMSLRDSLSGHGLPGTINCKYFVIRMVGWLFADRKVFAVRDKRSKVRFI
jgi:hypothetical protein